MIAQTAGSSQKPIQVLNQLCDNPNTRHGCVPIKTNMQRALEQFDRRPDHVGHA